MSKFFWLILCLLIIIFVIPHIVKISAPFEFMNMTKMGDLGSFLGGVTSPFISGLAAVLVYLAFSEQNKANKLLEGQIADLNIQEVKRIQRLRTLLMFDLEKKILPAVIKIEVEMGKLITNKKIGAAFTTYDYHVEFNSEIFKSINTHDLQVIFKCNEELLNIIRIYNRIDFLKSIIPINLSYKYRTDKDGLYLVSLSDGEATRVIDNHNSKILIETNLALKNAIPDLKTLISKFI